MKNLEYEITELKCEETEGCEGTLKTFYTNPTTKSIKLMCSHCHKYIKIKSSGEKISMGKFGNHRSLYE